MKFSRFLHAAGAWVCLTCAHFFFVIRLKYGFMLMNSRDSHQLNSGQWTHVVGQPNGFSQMDSSQHII